MLTATDLVVGYGRTDILGGISATAHRGQVVVVLGPNAAGKSTLLRSLVGVLPIRSGRVELDGDAIASMSPQTLASRLAYVPQRPSITGAYTVRDVVAMGRYALPVDRTREDRAMDAFDLAGVADRPFDALSVGQQQRVGLARAWAQVASDGILVLDEPTAALDLRHVRELLLMIRTHADEGGLVLVALHDLTSARSVADLAWLIDDGNLAASGPAETVMSLDRLTATYGVDFEHIVGADGQTVLLPRTRPARRIQTDPSGGSTG